MAIAELYQADYVSLRKIVRKLGALPDDADSIKIMNALGAELHAWIARHADPEAAEVLAAVMPRLSPDAKPLPALLAEFKQIIVKADAPAADLYLGALKFAFVDALEGFREFLAAKGYDPDQFEPNFAPVAPAPEVIVQDEMIEATTVEGADAPVEIETDPLLEPNAAEAVPEPAAAEPTGYKCEFCGYQYQAPPGKFCDNCGRVLSRINLDKDEESSMKKCLKCGLRNPREDRICKNCGELLREIEE